MKRPTCAELAAIIEALPDKERALVLSLLDLFEERKREQQAAEVLRSHLPARRVLQ